MATDLLDGTLETLDTAKFQAGLTAAVSKLSSASAKLALDDLATNTTLASKITDVQADVAKVLAAGTALDQAKKLFADLRTSILSISNDASTGTVDTEYTLMKEDFHSGISINSTFDSATLLADATAAFFTGNSVDTEVYGNHGFCQMTSATTAQCYIDGGATESYYLVTLTAGSTLGTANWNITEAHPWNGGVSVAISGLTGNVTIGANSAAVKGKLQPMTGNAAMTITDISFSQTGTVAGSRKWNGYGLLNTVKYDGSSTLKAEISQLTVDEAAYTAKLVLALTGPRHRFDGTLDLSGKLAASDGSNEQPKNGKLVGIFTNTSTNLKFFEGTLTASQDWTGYDPRQQETDANYAKATVSFDGTVYKSANVAGVTLGVTGNNTAGRKAQTVSLNFKGSNNVVVTGTGTQSHTANGDTWNWVLTNENGIKANYSNATKSGRVLKADGAELGTISTQRVTFVDGTFESLI